MMNAIKQNYQSGFEGFLEVEGLSKLNLTIERIDMYQKKFLTQKFQKCTLDVFP